MKSSFKLSAVILAAFFLVCATASPPLLGPDRIVSDDCKKSAYQNADCSSLSSKEAGNAKNVILIIGDGMGLDQVFAGRTYLKGPDKPLKWETLPHRGLITTCAIRSITDSAASGTAMATGHKTTKGAVCTGVLRGQDRMANINDIFGEKKAIGVVSTTKIWDATPAAFVAHSISRDFDRRIAKEMVTESRPRLMLGGGAKAFEPVEAASVKLDKTDIIGLAEKNGYNVARTASELDSLDPDSGEKVLGLFAPYALSFESEREEGTTEPHLTDMASFALDSLEEEPEGFFLMIEGARIDHACHKISMEKLVAEMVEFDKTVNMVLEWREKHPDTLVLITSDHETGGMKLRRKDYKKGDVLEVEWTRQDRPDHASHSSQQVPIYGIGPYASAIQDHMDNTKIFCLIKNAFENEG